MLLSDFHREVARLSKYHSLHPLHSGTDQTDVLTIAARVIKMT